MSDGTNGFGVIRVLAAAGLLLAWTAGAATAQRTDTRWLPFLGCWEATGESGAPVDDSMLCVRPSADAGVDMFSVTGEGQVTARETLRADGQRRDFTREGCGGWQSGEFSTDGSRVYLRSEQTCEGDVRRTSSGVLSMVTPYEWVDVQEVAVEGEGSTWSMRYRLVSDERIEAAGFGDVLEGRETAVRSARIAAARSPDVDDVIEVTDHVGAGVAQAWAVESDARFDLDAAELARMSDAGVPDEVIDIVVAVSYPSRFNLDRDARVTEVQPEVAQDYRARHPYGVFYDPWRWDPFYYGYGYRSFGYYPWGVRTGFYGGYYRPVIVRVEPRDDSPGGRVINGRGWRPGGSGSDRGAVRRSGGTSTGSAAGSGGGSVGSSRGSAGSSGSSTGRRAKRRGGGGGGGGGGLM